MRLTCFIFFYLQSLAGFCQQPPVLFDVKAERSGESNYTIIIQATLQKGWHVYAQKDEPTGIEALQISYSTTNVKTRAAKSNLQPVSITDPIFENKPLKVFETGFILTQSIHIEGTVPATLSVTIKCFASNQTEFLPLEETKEIKLEGGVAASTGLKLSSVDINNPAAGCGDKQDSKGILAIFLLGFGGGLLALLTPCIFPMIPVTVSFFTGPSTTLRTKTKKRGIRNGLLYGIFIFLIYLLASTPFHLIGNINPQIFNIISTNPFVNVFFFAVFILFALSFFGLFEIKLPSSIANTTANKGGIFFMALTLTVVSFSCTGIILGSLLVNALSANGNAWQLTAGMAGFGAALALPFGLFAMFPQWLQKLSKSGGWLDVVKKSLAFIELALAIKFLSNADLVEHWGILKREVFIGLWVLIALGLALYLFGIFDKKKLISLHVAGNAIKKQLPYGRITFGIITVLFALYLIPGVTQTRHANLRLLSGFPPPLSYSIYGKNNIHGKGLEPDVINDYQKAIALSKQTNKPLLIDFTGWACVNCRKMEEQVWTKSSIQQLIKDNYILVSLYVDDRKKLPSGKTVGETWAGFQADNFEQVTQPLYVILSPNEQLMNHPVGYTPKEEKYKWWLECGLDAYKKEKQLAIR